MDNKHIFNLMQNDIKKSKPIVINNDNFSNLKNNLGSKYLEDISDTEDDLSSYKKRNSNVINQMVTKKTIKKSLDNNLKNIKVISKINKDNDNNEDIKNIKDIKDIKDNENCKGVNIDEDIGEDIDSDIEEGIEENIEEDKMQYEYTEEFKEKVKTYVKNDDKIRELQIELKKLNSEKKAAEIEILKHLERLGENNISITGGKLRVNQYESKDGLKEDLIKEVLNEKIKDPKEIEKIFTKINEKRLSKSKIQISLKRTFERNTKK